MSYPSERWKTLPDGFTEANNPQINIRMPNTDTKRRNSPEIAALNDLLNTLNNPNIEGVVVPPGVNTKVPVETTALQPAIDAVSANFRADLAGRLQAEPPEPLQDKIKSKPLKIPAPVATPPATIRPEPAKVQKLFFTGRLKTGKDYAATAAGAEIISFAAPMYAIASYYFHTEISATVGKDLPGIREFLQTIGQWGRGVITVQYPLNVARALFIARVRAGGPKGQFGFPEVAWDTYGSNNDIWLDAAIIRADEKLLISPGTRVAFTNCRFDHEFKRLHAHGFQHWHSLCSPKTWAARLAIEKLTPESPAVRDVSEQLAANLDADVVKQLSAHKDGPKLRAIWNDNEAPCPSSRLHSVDSFLTSLGGY